MKSNVKMKVVGAAIGLIGFGLLVWQARLACSWGSVDLDVGKQSGKAIRLSAQT